MKKSPLIRFRIDFADSSNIGPGKIALLEAIHTHGSITAAARVLNMSYRRAWLLLESMNNSFTEPVSINSAGGIKGGGVRITPFGELLVQRYRAVEQRFEGIANDLLRDIQTRVIPVERASTRRPSVAKQALSKKKNRIEV